MTILKRLHDAGFFVLESEFDSWSESTRNGILGWVMGGSPMDLIEDIPKELVDWSYDGSSEMLLDQYDDLQIKLDEEKVEKWGEKERILAHQWGVLASRSSETGELPPPPPHVLGASDMRPILVSSDFFLLVESLCPQLDSEVTYKYFQEVTVRVESYPASPAVVIYLTDSTEARTARILHTLYDASDKISMSVVQRGIGEDIIFSESYSGGKLDNFHRVNDLSMGPMVWRAKFVFSQCSAMIHEGQSFVYHNQTMPVTYHEN